MARKILKVVSPIGSLLLGKKKKSASATTTPSVPTMPLPDDQAVANAKKEAIIRQRARGGRSSTILTDGEVLGGY